MQNIFFLQSKLISPLKQQKARVFLFGSRSTGKFQKFSDIDLLYVQGHNSPLPRHFIYSILSEIENSSFPCKVDLVKDSELALNYKDSVDKEKIEL